MPYLTSNSKLTLMWKTFLVLHLIERWWPPSGHAHLLEPSNWISHHFVIIRRHDLTGAVKVRKKPFLNDSLKNLYTKFCFKEKRFRVSYAFFCRLRPFWVLIPPAASRQTCLCATHENMRLLVSKLKVLNIIVVGSPDSLVKSICCESVTEVCLQGLCKQCKFHNCMFHIPEVRHQHESITYFKTNLQEGDILIHMDFSQNYECKYSEIQSAHFGGSKSQITLHTVEWYYHLSDNLRHDPASILANLNSLFKIIKDTFPAVNNDHFVSDGPTTRYKNKTMFFPFAAEFAKLLGPSNMTWNFTENGHGEGAADGIGGCVKRMADRVIAHGKDIPNLEILVEVLQKSYSGIVFSVIIIEDIESVDDLIPFFIKPFKGTLKIRSTIWSSKNPGAIHFRRLTCVVGCRYDVLCEHYHLGETQISPAQIHDRIKYSDVYSSSDESSDIDFLNQDESISHENALNVGDFAVVEYQQRCKVYYFGKIEAITANDQINVNFMRRIFASRKEKFVFVWPEEADREFVARSDIKNALPVPNKLRRDKYCFTDKEFIGFSNVKL
nr:unnamed protein product [Callosobruchus analis]